MQAREVHGFVFEELSMELSTIGKKRTKIVTQSGWHFFA
jgi:hypothetical protein